MNLIDYIQRHQDWSQKTFGDGAYTERILRHIEKESAEIRLAPLDLEEWADIIILGLDGAWRAGYTPEDIVWALEAKQTKNKSRRYIVPTDPNQPAEHDRTED